MSLLSNLTNECEDASPNLNIATRQEIDTEPPAKRSKRAVLMSKDIHKLEERLREFVSKHSLSTTQHFQLCFHSIEDHFITKKVVFHLPINTISNVESRPFVVLSVEPVLEEERESSFDSLIDLKNDLCDGFYLPSEDALTFEDGQTISWSIGDNVNETISC